MRRWLRTVLSLLLLMLAGGHEQLAAAQPQAARLGEIRIGLANHYKPGHWIPIWVDVDAAALTASARVQVIVPDSDGIETTAEVPLSATVDVGSRSTALLYTRIGRVGDPIRVRLLQGNQVTDERTLQLAGSSSRDAGVIAIPPTGELLVAFGPSAARIVQPLADRAALADHVVRRVANITRTTELPSDWFGFETVDVLVFSGNDRQLLDELASDADRLAALVQWIELGGRLVILCGGDDVQQLFGEGKPLSTLLPGTIAAVVRLPETARLEDFAKADEPIATQPARTPIMVPQLRHVEGSIEVYAGRLPTDLPMVVRTARGLGEITFAGLDFTKPPLAEWRGRDRFVQSLLRPYLAADSDTDTAQTLVTRGYDDLSGALRQRLGRSFPGVAPLGFPVVVLLAVAYLLVLGPLDYFLVQHWVRRPWAAWISFPLIVALFGITAMALANWRSGENRPRVNCLELVDIDTLTGVARGSFWATLYSPRAEAFDLALEMRPLQDRATNRGETLLSWWGLPGAGIGGMQGRRTDIVNVRGGYRYAEKRDALTDVPVLTSATKSLVGRWTTRVKPLLEAHLADEDGLPVGSIENRTGQSLQNLRLLYNGWGYRLGNLKEGQRVEIGQYVSPRTAKTIVTQDALGGAATTPDRNVFVPEQATAREILALMMFYERAGGRAFAQLPNRYQSYCDLSRLLELGRAILVAEASEHGSRLVNPNNATALDDHRQSPRPIYRFVLPVEKM